MPNFKAGADLFCLGCGVALRAKTKYRFMRAVHKPQKVSAIPGADFCEACGVLAVQAMRNYFGGSQIRRGEGGDKYSHVVINGIEFKLGEPWFLIRGQDCTAPAAIEAYYQLIKAALGPAHPIAVSSRNFLTRVREWQKEHPTWIKEPD